MAEVAGYWLVGAAIHILGSLAWAERAGWRRRVSPPWRARACGFSGTSGARQAAAAPLGLLGGLVAWTASRGAEPPLWMGALLLAWLLAAASRMPRGGFWLGIVPALLLLDRVD